MKAKVRFAVVSWLDAWAVTHSEATVETVAEDHNPEPMETAGWVLLDDEKGVSLFAERGEKDGTYRGRTFIPRQMIQSVSYVRLVPERPAKEGRRSTTRRGKAPKESDPSLASGSQESGQERPQDQKAPPRSLPPTPTEESEDERP